MTPQKICFRYDGSEESKEALEIVKRKFNKDHYVGLHNVYYYSDVDMNIPRHDPDYTLVSPSEFVRLMKGEECEWKVGDEAMWQEYKKTCKGKILAIYDNSCWFLEDDDSYYILKLSVLRPISKSLREELIDWANKYESVLEAMPELLAIIDRHEKERGVEG